MGSIIEDAKTISSPSAILPGAEPVIALICVLLYCCTLYDFSSSGISSVAISCQALNSCRAFYPKRKHQTSTVMEHLESGSWPGLRHMCRPGHVQTWPWSSADLAMVMCRPGHDSSFCVALEQKRQ